MMLGLGPEILYSIDVIAQICKKLIVINMLVVKHSYIQGIIRPEYIGINDTTGGVLVAL
jgi:hypothetical protein